jgi:hypothetical protein
VLFKIDCGVAPLVREMRGAVAARYREGGRLVLVNFVADVAERASARRIARVPPGWYTTTVI